jgi:hypothetical protein
MSESTSTGLREEVRARYAAAARAVLDPAAAAGCCGPSGASVTFTHQAAPGMHSAIIRAVKPAR